MFRPPYLARVAAGAAVFALEETRKLPSAAVQLPITAVSQVLQTTMQVQQFVASLAAKGDEALRGFAGEPEQAEWATFDEDVADLVEHEDSAAAAPAGRFALYSAPDAATAAPPATPGVSGDGETPEIVEILDYPALTLAQLRARLRTLSAAELDDLLDYEQHHHARAPFLTMLANRIATTKAK